MVGILLLFALLCFGGSFGAEDGLRWLLAGTALVSTLVALLSWGYALFRRPELLRSESHSLLTRYFDVLEDSEMDPATRERVSNVILGSAEELLPKRLAETGQRKAQGGAQERDNG
jgi:hypothetical protein